MNKFRLLRGSHLSNTPSSLSLHHNIKLGNILFPYIYINPASLSVRSKPRHSQQSPSWAPAFPNTSSDTNAPNPPEAVRTLLLSYHGFNRVPQCASLDPAESQDWYTDFFEVVEVVPHKDGQSVIIFSTHDPEEETADRGWTQGNRYVRYARKINERLVGGEGDGVGHLRIVKYLGPLPTGENTFCLERLFPGPFTKISLPSLTLPVVVVASAMSKQYRTLLSLYYRWALQTLSALQYIHSQSIYLTDFSSQSIWIRDDLSAAVTGYINAHVSTMVLVPRYGGKDGLEEVWVHEEQLQASDADEGHSAENTTYHDANPQTGFCVKYDLFDWAT
ncbi:hypothetical protein AJ80_02394 [Polytolypa hystricis UAMH7299]|uniref:Protein kinase domain-containing protein n=1 Tax=Polytolypa hystricis (strain UAMH7299) TaxID=1447883 RepID=A0A2B7YRJ1_POLH7|nr:hypothetical protein AJ80_02394 [Polytolypa hystricis UAMH7299]